MPDSPLSFGSLFAGIGGFDLGFERAGMVCKWQVEIDSKCRQVLDRHFDAEQFEDVHDVGAKNLIRVDVVCGGFPCQDLSVAGRRAGLAGKRSGLFFELMRIVDEITPAWVVIENVPGLLSSNEGRDIGAVVGGLAELGYGWAYRVFDAQWFGVAQRRKRVFIVGCLGNGRRAAEVLFERESLPWDTPPSREEGAEVAPCIRGGIESGSNEAGNKVAIAFGGNNTSGPIDVATACNAKASRSGRQDFESETFITHTLRAEGHDASEDGTGRGVPIVPVCVKPFTITGVQQDMTVRRLTVTECERVQGFPDGWTAGHSDSARYRMIGNAVVPAVAEWIGRRLIKSV